MTAPHRCKMQKLSRNLIYIVSQPVSVHRAVLKKKKPSVVFTLLLEITSSPQWRRTKLRGQITLARITALERENGPIPIARYSKAFFILMLDFTRFYEGLHNATGRCWSLPTYGCR